MRHLIRALACTLVLAALPALSQAAFFISVNIAPPALPVYELPPEPGPGYIWTPGYWAWDGAEYYWVPGTWVLAPVGMLWTPGFWGWDEGVYIWHEGYWGPQVGFYGGVDYGFGYPGQGYRGGEWRGREFVENRAIINNVTINRVSYNGGQGGIAARPTGRDIAAARQHHLAPMPVQRQHERMAAHNRELRASVNGGRPPIAATPRPGVFSGAGVVPARNSARGSGLRAAERPNEGPRGSSATRGNSLPRRRAAPSCRHPASRACRRLVLRRCRLRGCIRRKCVRRSARRRRRRAPRSRSARSVPSRRNGRRSVSPLRNSRARSVGRRSRRISLATPSSLQHPAEPGSDVGNFLRADAVGHRVGVPLDAIARGLERSARVLAEDRRNGRILQPVGQEDGRRLVGRTALRVEAIGEQQVARERQDPCEFLRVAGAGDQGERAALRKSGQHDFLGGHAALVLPPDESLDRRL